jgi:hypothetical protein
VHFVLQHVAVAQASNQVLLQPATAPCTKCMPRYASPCTASTICLQGVQPLSSQTDLLCMQAKELLQTARDAGVNL